MAKPMAYVVFRGKTPGIYTSWKSCQEQIRGIARPEVQVFGSRYQAQLAWDERQSFSMPPSQVNTMRKRSDSVDGDELGKGQQESSRSGSQIMEVADSEDDSSSIEEWKDVSKIRWPRNMEIPDSEDDSGLSDEEYHSATSQIEIPGVKRDAEDPSDETSIVRKIKSEFAHEAVRSPNTDTQDRKPDINIENKSNSVKSSFSESTVTSIVKKPLDSGEIILTPDQQAVVSLAENGDNLFITGAAGSGKTATLKEILRRLEAIHVTKNEKYPTVAVTAPTGISSLALQGRTTWSWAGWNMNSFHRPFDKLLGDTKKSTRWAIRELKVLIIDEISMVENQFLERLNLLMKDVMNSLSPFGGKQMIIVGDFHQLPPVKPFECCVACGEPLEKRPDGVLCSTQGCRLPNNELMFKWEDKWAFRADVWKKLRLKHIRLEQIHRQKDTRFQSTLNKIRNGISLTDEEWTALEIRKDHEAVPIRLMSRVETVRNFNNNQLHLLKTEPKSWLAQDTCRKESRSSSDNPQMVARQKDYYLSTLSDHQFLPGLTLKVGAKVLLLYNLAPELGLVNGSQGELLGFADCTTWPIEVPEGDHKELRLEMVRAFHKQFPWRPIVRFANDRPKTIAPIAAVSLRGRSDDRYLVCRTQIPLALGWALSIHKSQGMTLDFVELSSRDIFEPGQLYVGLSRATTLNGLTVTGFERRLLGVDEEVLKFYRDTEWVDLGQVNRSISYDNKFLAMTG